MTMNTTYYRSPRTLASHLANDDLLLGSLMLQILSLATFRPLLFALH